MKTHKPRTLALFLGIVATYTLLLLPGLWSSFYRDSVGGPLVLAPYLTILGLHAVGVPGLLERNGLCDGGWCSPTVPGWTLAGVVWLAITWVIAALIDRLTRPRAPCRVTVRQAH
ncbi:MAG: hypothetical protein ABI411_12290 [Tahibacter sp.]